jgi:uncharacterized membrane protein (DUF2068 family)
VTRSDRDVGLRLVTTYKLIKGAVQLVLAGLLFVAIERGVASDWLHALALFARHHLASAASVKLAGLLVALSTPRRLGLSVLALACDGALTTLEGVALQRGHWWGPWLVVAATGALLPYELFELVQHPRVGRALLVLLNAAVVAYLGWRALREHRARQQGAREHVTRPR